MGFLAGYGVQIIVLRLISCIYLCQKRLYEQSNMYLKLKENPNVIVDLGKFLHNNNTEYYLFAIRVFIYKNIKKPLSFRDCVPKAVFKRPKKAPIISDEKGTERFEDAVQLSRFLDGGGRFQSHSQQSRRRGISSSLAHCENLIP
jgi:hypothetical protein